MAFAKVNLCFNATYNLFVCLFVAVVSYYFVDATNEHPLGHHYSLILSYCVPGVFLNISKTQKQGKDALWSIFVMQELENKATL